jgi:hypothetical protein
MMNITSWGENSEEAVRAFEQQVGFALPEDYREFLIKSNGARVNNQTFFVKDLDQEILMHVLYGLTNDQNRSLTLGYWLAEHGEDIGEKELVVGHDQGGHQILLVTDGENKGLYYWDHNHFFAKSSEAEGDTYFVADTFTEFCDSLKDRKPATV